MLEDRFGRKERIIFAHIQGLLNVTMQNPCGKGSRVSNLWKLRDELLSHIRSLESLGIKGEDYGVFLTPVILSRLPNDIRMEWACDGAGKESNLEWLLEFLRKEIERRECSETFKEVTVGKTDKPDHSSQEEKRSKPRIPTVSALQSSTGDTGCGFCGRRHATEKCWDVLELPIPERQQRILEAKLCFRCLCKGHIAKGCTAKCSKCNGRHHQLCCKGNVNHGNSKASSETPSLHEKSNKAQLISEKETGVSVVGVFSSKPTESDVPVYAQKCSTMLQTAVVNVKSKNKVVRATLLFDSGSDKSYVTHSLVKRVRPEWVSSEPLRYATFGSSKANQCEIRNVFKLELEGNYGQSESLIAVEIPVICAPLSRSSLSLQAFGVIR